MALIGPIPRNATKYLAACVGRRRLDVARLPDGHVLLQVLLARGDQLSVLASLVLEPDQAKALRVGLTEALKHKPAKAKR